jgi:hypothetical protein
MDSRDAPAAKEHVFAAVGVPALLASHFPTRLADVSISGH